MAVAEHGGAMSNTRYRVLIVEDNRTDRDILLAILQKQGHDVVVAENGEQALLSFEQSSPDIILLDAVMPGMTGYEVAKTIKHRQSPNAIFTPIIFLTSLSDPAQLADCIHAGGDDFLTKPYHATILQAKLDAMMRLKQLHATVCSQRDKIQFHTDRLVHEQEVAKRVFDNITHSANVDIPFLRYVLSPLSLFNGDLILVAKTPSKGVHLLLGDFTGHGLPAAIGAVPLSEIFYGMTYKGFDLADILAEINSRLKHVLPTGVFCCAVAADVSVRSKTVKVWNGGMPEAYLVRKGCGIVSTITSSHLPLGILSKQQFQAEGTVVPYEYDDQLLLYSDGVVEATNGDDVLFGQERLVSVVQTHAGQSLVEPILMEIKQYQSSEQQEDDITLAELTLSPELANQRPEDCDIELSSDSPNDLTVEYRLGPESLKSFDPLPLILHLLMEYPVLRPHRSSLYTILAEMYANALEHGVLGLDSQIKKTAEGFTRFYHQREQRLQALTEGYVSIYLEMQPDDQAGMLLIRVTDSGQGAAHASHVSAADDDCLYSGRGLSLIDGLCESFELSVDSHQAIAYFCWQQAQQPTHTNKELEHVISG